MTTVTERRLVREVEDTSPLDTSPSPSIQSGGSAGVGSPISGILKGGKLWKQQSGADTPVPVGTPLNKASENLQVGKKFTKWIVKLSTSVILKLEQN